MKPARIITLGIVFGSLAVGAVVLDWFERNRVSRGLLGRTLLSGVDLSEAGLVLIETAERRITMRRSFWGWTVDEHDGFAADSRKLRTLLLQLAGTPVAQRVPVPPERLGELGLLQKVENDWQFEAGRTATVLSVIKGIDDKHKMMAQVLIGNLRPSGGATFVRFPVSNTAYLVAGELMLDADPDQWIERRIFVDEPAAEIESVQVRPRGGSPLLLARSGPTAGWVLRGHRAAPDPAAVRELMDTLASLQIERIGPRSPGPPQPARGALVEVRFFDRRGITLDFQEPAAGSARPVLVRAWVTGPTAEREVGARVYGFNQRFGGRIVEVDGSQSERLLRGRHAYQAAR